MRVKEIILPTWPPNWSLSACQVTVVFVVQILVFVANQNLPFLWDVECLKFEVSFELSLIYVIGASCEADGRCVGTSFWGWISWETKVEVIEESKPLIELTVMEISTFLGLQILSHECSIWHPHIIIINLFSYQEDPTETVNWEATVSVWKYQPSMFSRVSANAAGTCILPIYLSLIIVWYKFISNPCFLGRLQKRM